MEVISCLDELAWHVPARKAWDELMFPTPPAAPCQSRHLRYIMGHTMYLGSALWFCISGLSGEFICIAWGLLFKGVCLPMTLPPMGSSGSPCGGLPAICCPLLQKYPKTKSTTPIHTGGGTIESHF